MFVVLNLYTDDNGKEPTEILVNTDRISTITRDKNVVTIHVEGANITYTCTTEKVADTVWETLKEKMSGW